MQPGPQLELGFNLPAPPADHQSWRDQRQAALEELARRMRLPPGAPAADPALPPLELGFDLPSSHDGYQSWRDQRQAALEELARRMGLPLGHQVEVWLADGVRLRGKLQLREERLFLPEARDWSLEFAVDGVSFPISEMESCVRLD